MIFTKRDFNQVFLSVVVKGVPIFITSQVTIKVKSLLANFYDNMMLISQTLTS